MKKLALVVACFSAIIYSSKPPLSTHFIHVQSPKPEIFSMNRNKSASPFLHGGLPATQQLKGGSPGPESEGAYYREKETPLYSRKCKCAAITGGLLVAYGALALAIVYCCPPQEASTPEPFPGPFNTSSSTGSPVKPD